MEASPHTCSKKLVFNLWENTHQAALGNHATVCYYGAARDMAVRVAGGGVSHDFLYNNVNGLNQSIFENNDCMFSFKKKVLAKQTTKNNWGQSFAPPGGTKKQSRLRPGQSYFLIVILFDVGLLYVFIVHV